MLAKPAKCEGYAATSLRTLWRAGAQADEEVFDGWNVEVCGARTGRIRYRRGIPGSSRRGVSADGDLWVFCWVAVIGAWLVLSRPAKKMC